MLLLRLLSEGRGGGGLMARGMYFRKLRLEEYMAPSSLCLYQYPPEVSLCSRNRISVSSGKGMELYHKLCISGNKIRWKLRLVGFSYDKNSANVVMWKDKENKYISSA